MTRRRAQSGQQMMELALVMPVFIALVVGGIWLLLGLVNQSQAGWTVQKAALAAVAASDTDPAVAATTATSRAHFYLDRTLMASVPTTDGCLDPATPPEQRLWICTSATGTGPVRVSVQITGWIASALPFNNGLEKIDVSAVESSHSVFCTSC